MIAWVVRSERNARTWALERDELLIGRAPDCAIQIDVAAVSLHHAAIRLGATGPVIEVKGRGAVVRNGEPVTGATQLAHGDRITIARVTFIVEERERARRELLRTLKQIGSELEPPRPRAAVADGPSGTSTIDLLLSGIEETLARNDVEGCSWTVERLLEIMSSAERANDLEGRLLRRGSGAVLRAAGVLRRGAWIDAIVELHRVRRRPMWAAPIDALEGALDRIAGHDRACLGQYVSELAGAREHYNAYEQFCLERLELIARGR